MEPKQKTQNTVKVVTQRILCCGLQSYFMQKAMLASVEEFAQPIHVGGRIQAQSFGILITLTSSCFAGKSS